MERQQEIKEILGAENNVVAALNSVEALQEAFPFFTLPSAILLDKYKNDITDDVRQKLIRRIALSWWTHTMFSSPAYLQL